MCWLPHNFSLPPICRSAKIVNRDEQLPINGAHVIWVLFPARSSDLCAGARRCKLTCGTLSGIVVETEAYDAEETTPATPRFVPARGPS